MEEFLAIATVNGNFELIAVILLRQKRKRIFSIDYYRVLLIHEVNVNGFDLVSCSSDIFLCIHYLLWKESMHEHEISMNGVRFHHIASTAIDQGL